MEKNTERYPQTVSAAVVQIICTKELIPGTDREPDMVVTRFWTLDGKLLAETKPQAVE